MPKKWSNQYGYGPDPKEEWRTHAEMFKDTPNFEDDPAAEAADRIGSYSTKSVGTIGVFQGEDDADFADNGEKIK